MLLGIKTRFDSAHYLPFHEGKCFRTHGHTWHVEVQIEGEPDENGMILDFSIVKQYVNKLIDSLDHKLLNDVLPPTVYPTCESLALYIKSELSKTLPIYLVRVQEGEGGYAIA